MGGQGSGRRWHCGSRNTTEDYQSIDVRRFQQEGMLAPGYSTTWQWLRNGEAYASIGVKAKENRIVLSYRSKENSGKWQDMEYPVFLEWTQCHYGGRRAWFRCPAVGCGRRVAVLYAGKVFACRHCYNLAYASQREKGADQTTRKANKIRKRLGWKPGILNHPGGKPKGMRWRTFERLQGEHDGFSQTVLNDLARKIGLLNKRLG